MQVQSYCQWPLRQGPWTPRVVPVGIWPRYSLRAANLRYIVDYGARNLFRHGADPIERPTSRTSAHGPCAICATGRLLTWPIAPAARGHLGLAQQSDGGIREGNELARHPAGPRLRRISSSSAFREVYCWPQKLQLT